MKKTYVLDTNVLLSDPDAIYSFQEHDVIVPMVVLEELDNHKSRQDEVGKNSRAVSRQLDELRKKGSLHSGIALPGGGSFRVVTINPKNDAFMPPELTSTKVDNMLIAFMQRLTTKAQKTENIVLVSKDINVRLKCDALGILCEDYKKIRIAESSDKLYTGVDVLEVDEEVVDNFFINGSVQIPAKLSEQKTFYPNQIVVIKNVQNGVTTKSAITKFIEPGQPLIPIRKIESAFNLKPRNKEQNFSLDLLFDNNVKLLTLTGPSGTGKTLLAIAAALEQLQGLGDPDVVKYEKLIVTRPVQPVGRDIGFLPGTMEEKMEPWIAPIRDNINFLMGNKKGRSRRKVDESGVKKPIDEYYLSIMQERGLIEIEAITFIRGRSIPNAFIIIDEAQNLSMHELKTIITRAGDNTKIVLTGDIEQIDNIHVDTYTNGLTYAVERFKNEKISGHVSLLKGERSPLATIASKIL